jgi:hypothetical protein
VSQVDVDGQAGDAPPAEKRGRGRPKGAKNKTKASAPSAASSSARRETEWEPPSRQEIAEAQLVVGGVMVLAQGLGGDRWSAATAKHGELLADALIRLSRAYDIQLSEQAQAWMALTAAATAIAHDAGAFDQLRDMMRTPPPPPPPPPSPAAESAHAQ